MTMRTLVEAINDALLIALAADERVLMMGEDVGRNGGVFRATEGLLERFGEERVIDTPLAEAGIVGTAVGLAIYGMHPIVEIQFLGFSLQAFAQITAQAARIRSRSQGRFTCPLVIRAPYGGGVRAFELHGDALEAHFVHMPGLKVVAPATAYDAKGLFLAAMADPDPVIFLEPLREYRSSRAEVPEGHYTIPLGKAKVVREGRNVTIITWSSMVKVALDAAEILQDKEIEAEVIDVRTLVPFDAETILKSVQKTSRVVIVHEGAKTAGVGAEIIAMINENAFFSLDAPIARITGYDIPIVPAMLEDSYIPSSQRIVETVCQLILS